jgi:anti-sigma factor RsiW
VSACDDVRATLLDYQAGRLAPAAHDAVLAHLETCAACAREDAAEHVLTEVLERRLPQYPAPIALKRRLAAAWAARTREAPPAAAREHAWRRRRAVALAGSALAGGALLVTVLAFAVASWRGAPDVPALAREAVAGHLRVVERRDALPVASREIHQVKPWFTGRIDFAPVVRFAGDADFPLRGGAVERFLDRQAAVLVYGRRLHTISLLVFRADGLAWPRDGGTPHRASVRGFNVLVWRAGDLGYALVSDVDARDLADLAARLGAG